MTDNEHDSMRAAPTNSPRQGEDDGSTEHGGQDGHLHDDQKSPASKQDVVGDGDGKTQDLARAGRDDFDPNANAE